MIHELGYWKNIEWETAAAERVFHYCGGHPFVTRLFASEVSGWGTIKNIDLARVEEAAKATLASLRRNLIGSYFAGSIWEELRQREQELLVRLARSTHLDESQILDGDSEADLSHLENLRLAQIKEGRIQSPGAFFDAWLERRTAI